jgi:hypothetical protein
MSDGFGREPTKVRIRDAKSNAIGTPYEIPYFISVIESARTPLGLRRVSSEQRRGAPLPLDVAITSYDNLMARPVRCESSTTWPLPPTIISWYALYDATVRHWKTELASPYE